MTYSRRDLAKLTLAGFAIAPALAKSINSKVDGVQLGVQSYSFRDLSLDDAIKAMVADGLGDCELFSPHIENGGMQGARPAFDPKMSPADRKAFFEAREAKLHDWRMTVPMSYFEGIKKKFNDNGIKLYAYNFSFSGKMTDEEIDRGFEMAKALGVGIITASTTLPVAQRVVPFADKHKMIVAMHGHSDLKDPNQFATPESFAKALAMSPYYRINLDIGHFTAANFDAVDFIDKNHEKIVLIHLKDRKKNEGDNTVWGEGDTPIKQVLLQLKDKKYPIPAFIEYEYKGTGDSQAEVLRCYLYAKMVLEG